MTPLTVLGTALILASSPALPSEEDLVGAWVGKIEVAPKASLTMVFRIAKPEDGPLKATFASPDQGAREYKVEEVTLDGRDVSLAVATLGGTFEGTFAEDGKAIDGVWTQAGHNFPLVLARAAPEDLRGPEAPKALLGTWQGKIEVGGGTSLRMVLRVEEGKDGRRSAVLDSPDQGVRGIPVTAIDLADGMLTFEVSSVGGSYRGTVDEATTAVKGEWSQGGGSVLLNLEKTEKVEEARRPQHPMPPYPYRVEEVSYRNEEGGVTLAGTLTLPEGDGPFPAALLITGSGPQDRDETIFGHKPFLVLADALTRRGIAVLRVDDRGVGGSKGTFGEATSEDFAGDALAGVRFLEGRAEVDASKVGLIGHSEGGIVGPMVAGKADVAFLVLMAGTGLTGEEILARQNRLILKAAGASDRAIDQQVAMLARAIQVVKGGGEVASKEKLRAVVREALEALTDEEREALGSGAETIVEAQIGQIASPWFRFFLAYDPRPALAKVRCPVLAINGANDLQVPPKENLEAIAGALREAGNDRVTVREFPGLNHLFQTSRTGAPSEYGAIEETMAPAVLESIGDWILRNTKNE